MNGFKFKTYSEVLAKQIINSFDNPEPLTIGIIGEWGSGKSYLLHDIKSYFDTKQHDRLIIPIFFNAWRFEKEKHLIVPLLKTTYHQIQKKQEQQKQLEKQNSLDKAKKLMGSIVIATASALEIDMLGIKFSGQDLIKNLKKEYESDNKNDNYESIYFDILEKFKFIIDQNVNFVFLIDDLDRCLPENVLKMLESIKLFLDVQGCAFVLAVDDEIVERGVEHHYKNYKDKNNKLPITGFEYLEKMINLPYKIPSLEKDDIKEFLSSHEIFKIKPNPNNSEPKEQLDNSLIELFLNIVPPIPRKLLRAINLYETKLELLKTANIQLDKSLIANLVFLELFAPKLYRYLKNSYPSGFGRLHSWKNEFNSLGEINNIQSQSVDKTAEEETKNRYQKLLDEVKEIQHSSRNRFDLNKITFNYPQQSINSYFSLKAQKLKKQPQNLITLTKKQQDKLLKLLFDKDPFTQSQAFEEYENSILDSQSVDLIIQKIKKDKEFVTDKWLKIVQPHLSYDDFIKIIETSQIIPKLIKEINNEK